MKTIKNLAIACTLFLSVASFAQRSKTAFGKSTMNPSNTILENLSKSQEYSSFDKILKNAEYIQYLSEGQEFTILAPTNEAFSKKASVFEEMNKPENIFLAKDFVAYHIIQGKWYISDFGKLIREGKDKGEIKTVDGDVLTITWENNAYYFTDKNGTKAKLVLSDAVQSNGILHGIDNVFSAK